MVDAVESFARFKQDAAELRLGNGTAAMFLAAWLEAGLVVEFAHIRHALTAKGDRLALPEQEATRRFQEAGEGS